VNSFRTDYATCKDFCAAFEREMDRFYLLAFLLTGSHTLAEECFLRVMHSAPGNQTVLKRYVPTWIRRTVIKDAIVTVFVRSSRQFTKQDPWFEGASAKDAIEHLVELSDIDRFVYVMAVLEGYSTKQCSLLLGRTVDVVNAAKVRALTEIGADLPFPIQLAESLRATA
jgi:DNA-directed RNA polymerase specialized sigma24 family protein